MRAISPVIATVIIVSVAIAISIAVALWLTGITSGFTQTENLQIVSSYAVYDNNADKFYVNITVKNTGTVAATIDNIFINGKPASDYGTSVDVKSQLPLDINSGENITLTIVLSSPPFTHGQMVNIKIHTASGRDYPTTVTLP